MMDLEKAIDVLRSASDGASLTLDEAIDTVIKYALCSQNGSDSSAEEVWEFAKHVSRMTFKDRAEAFGNGTIHM